jgi:hypothetical protein
VQAGLKYRGKNLLAIALCMVNLHVKLTDIVKCPLIWEKLQLDANYRIIAIIVSSVYRMIEGLLVAVKAKKGWEEGGRISRVPGPLVR